MHASALRPLWVNQTPDRMPGNISKHIRFMPGASGGGEAGIVSNDSEQQFEAEYQDFLRTFLHALHNATMPPVAEIPIDELELLEVIVPNLLIQLERADNPVFDKARTQKIKRNLLAWWNEEDVAHANKET
jgi:hypothetical protein